MAGFAPGLASIAARPPTPPKENTARASPSNGFGSTTLDHVLLHTPDESPSSSAEFSKESTGKAHKKVGFTLLGTQYHRFSVGGHESDSDGPIRQLPRSRDCKSSKSILKVCTDNVGEPSSNELLAFDNTSLPAMLRSTTKHLASASRFSRLDAYASLLACLGAYDEIPETQELAEKVAEITRYIRRDVMANNEEDGSLDIQLATKALKLVTFFLCNPGVAAMLPEEFCLFMLERSISSLEDQGSPKILISHYMHVLQKQKFSSKYMTTDRVNRLITALDAVTVWVKGNRVVGHRLMIYQRLLGQAKLLMVSRVTIWIDHLISGMLSTIKDIRARAIAFGVDASLQLGATNSVSQACIDMFNRASADGTKVVDFLSSRLIEMANSKEDGSHVPQIWSVVIMFLRSRRRQLEGWEHLKAWLVILQRCFNSSDGQTKLQANIAWNRLIFAINLDTSTSTSMAKMLRQPLVSQLERRSSDKNFKMAKQIAHSSYCTLLYYALRPTATHAQLDQYWDLYVYQILPSCFIASENDINYACDILSALFSGKGKPKIWEDNRTNDGPIGPEDLPSLDPKWVRFRTARIVHIFDKLFDIADWHLCKDGQAPVVQAWRSFTLALGNAGGKEVKVSMDAMNAVAHIINEMKLMLDRSNLDHARNHNNLPVDVASKANQSEIFEKITVLIGEAVAKIGNLAFIEPRLIRTLQDSFEAADTPSSRSSRDSGSLDSAVAHLLNTLLRNGQRLSNATSYKGALKTVLNISLQSTTSRRIQLGILRNLARLVTLDDVHQKEASVVFWRLLAEGTCSALKQSQQNETHNDSPQYSGHEFRDAVKILELGIQLRSVSNKSTLHELHTGIIDAVRKEVGNEAIGLVILEPLAGFISKDENPCDDFVLDAAALMIETVQWPQSPHLIERAHRRLWGVTHVASKANALDPFDNLYSMVGSLLSSSYPSLEGLSSATVIRFIATTTKMIASCPPEHVSTILLRIQKGLAPWIEDAKGLLNLRPSSPFRNVYSEVSKLWTKVVNWIERSTVFDTRFLFSIQELMVAGFRSRHKPVVNVSIAMWNNTFGVEDALEYPEELRVVLQKLRSMTELNLPTFPERNGEEVISSPSRFVDSQDEEEIQAETVMSPPRPPNSVDSLQGISKSIKGVQLNPGSGKAAAFRGSPAPAQRRVKTTPKARLRHDDSQIQFAAIESSPLQSEPLESQCLTDHQKDVKERQGREAAAMFPEIRSSPRTTSRSIDYNLPKLVLKPTQDPIQRSTTHEDTSPTCLPDVLMDEFLGSSPTPNSKRSSDRPSIDDPPSSPPVIPPDLRIDHLTDPSLANEGRGPMQQTINAEENLRNHFADKSLSSMRGYPIYDESNDATKDDHRLVNDQKDVPNVEAEVTADPPPVSVFDTYVGATLEPSLDESPREHDNLQTKDIAHPFQREASSQFSVEDEQVTAQLFAEMERASSQQSAKQDEVTQSARRATKKRKRTADSSTTEKKKKRISNTLNYQAAAGVPTKSETVADCVMINVREADRARPLLSQRIKREPSASPSILMSSQAVEEPAVAGKPPADHLMIPAANQSSSQEEDTPVTAKKAVGRPRGSRNSQVKQGEAEKEQASRQRIGTRVSERLSGSTTSSTQQFPAVPQESTKAGPWLALGKTPQRGMFRWLRRSSAESEDGEALRPTNSSAKANNAEEVTDNPKLQDAPPDEVSPTDPHREHQSRSENEHHEVRAKQGDIEAQAEARGSVETEEEAASADIILQRFHSMLDDIKRVTFGPEEERTVVGMLFECVKEVHEAGRRHTSM